MSTPPVTESPLILLTGSTGYLGFATLIQALKAGYRVRAAVRNIERAKEKILNSRTLRSSSLELAQSLTFITVNDILLPSAYNEAIKGVDYVIHVASPMPGAQIKDFEEELVKPAVAGTIGILKAAYSEASIKRIVITSSIAANIDPHHRPSIINAQTRVSTPTGPHSDLFSAYVASKIAALNASEDFVERRKPIWDIVSIQPGFIIGSNELAQTAEEFLAGTAANPIRAYISEPPSVPTAAVHVQDAAYLHVAALNPLIEGNRSYGATITVDWNTAWPVLERKFSAEVKQGIFTKNEVHSSPLNWDARESETKFGFKFRSFEDTVVELAEDWLSKRIS